MYVNFAQIYVNNTTTVQIFRQTRSIFYYIQLSALNYVSSECTHSHYTNTHSPGDFNCALCRAVLSRHSQNA